MDKQTLTTHSKELIDQFCVQIDSRSLGSDGNRQASTIFDEWMAKQGFVVENQVFDCQDWQGESASLIIDGQPFEVYPSPHSLPCRVEAELLVATTLDELKNTCAKGKILLLRGEIAQTQLFPTNYPYYYPDEHRAIYEALLTLQPAALLTATAFSPDVAGAQYPLQMIEDGNFDIPSVYFSEEEGLRLAAYAGRSAKLESRCRRIPTHAWNSIARLNPDVATKVVLCAHIDAKPGAPGALDNAAGIVTLMLLAELLKASQPGLCVEIVSLNGEDHYAAAGEMAYLASVQHALDKIKLLINLDGLGFVNSQTAYSLYGCPDELAVIIRSSLGSHSSMVEDDPWFQSDHSVFIQQGVPAVALTSADLGHMMQQITHTPNDSPDKVDPGKLSEAALALKVLVIELDNHWGK
jgi:aminopeptidase YwaD